jgi:hypothetical protein
LGEAGRDGSFKERNDLLKIEYWDMELFMTVPAVK